jgi:hypothetical protein
MILLCPVSLSLAPTTGDVPPGTRDIHLLVESAQLCAAPVDADVAPVANLL